MATNPLQSFVAHALADADPDPREEPVPLQRHQTAGGGYLLCAAAADAGRGAWIHTDPDALVDLAEVA